MRLSVKSLNEKYGIESPFRPDPLSRKVLSFSFPGKRVLDIGCGEGADSVFYAEKGFEVKAFDNNQDYLKRIRAYVSDQQLKNVSIKFTDVIKHPYRLNYYDVISCLLVGCCMKRSEFDTMLERIKRAVKIQGLVAMSLRNYLDPEYKDYALSDQMIEPNTFLKRDDCCKIRYYIEKNRLRECFEGFEILYYYEGYAADKYKEVEKHGDSYIICRRIV